MTQILLLHRRFLNAILIITVILQEYLEKGWDITFFLQKTLYVKIFYIIFGIGYMGINEGSSYNEPFMSLIKNGAKGIRTHDLSHVKRTLIPAELWLQVEHRGSNP